MAKKAKLIRLNEKDIESATQILIAFSQVTFGIAWGSIFLPVDQFKSIVIILNAVTTLLLVFIIWLLNRI